jgi:hypothetical protein
VEKYDADKFVVLGVDFQDKREHIQKVFEEKKLPWRSFFMGDDFSFADKVGAELFPTYIVLDKDLKMRSLTNKLDYDTIEECVQELN